MQLRYPLLWSVIVLLSSAHVHSAALAQPTAKKPDKQYTIELSGGIPLDTGLYAVVGQRHQLQAALVKHGRKEISATFEWKSSDPAVAAVVDGWLEARSYGTAELTVKETLTALSRALRVVVSADQFFWTANQAEMETMLLENPHTYQFDGVGFEVMGSAEDDPLLVPLWRFHETTTGTHFWTTDEHGEQFLPPFNSLPGVREGIAAHVYGAPLAGTLPVYRWWNPLTGVHFWSTDPDGENFGAAGVLEGIAFWALPSNSGVAGAIPMARARCYNCGDAAFGSSGLFVPQRGQN